MNWIRVDTPQVGDMADHKTKDLDPRRVTKVKGSQIWIEIGDIDAGPLPAANYTYKREHHDT